MLDVGSHLKGCIAFWLRDRKYINVSYTIERHIECWDIPRVAYEHIHKSTCHPVPCSRQSNLHLVAIVYCTLH